MVSDAGKSYGIQVEWETVVPLGDALGVRTNDGVDDRWVKAFEVVLDERRRRTAGGDWGAIEFEYASGARQGNFVLYVREIKPEAKSSELRRTLDDLAKAANTVAQVGTHVYDLARELRGDEATTPQPAGSRSSTPPPARERPAEDLRADAA
jgi:hypothetical protein